MSMRAITAWRRAHYKTGRVDFPLRSATGQCHWLSAQSAIIRGQPCRSRIRLPEALAKVVPPALGKRGKFACLAQKILVRGVRRIHADDLGDADRKLVPGDRSDVIAGLDFALAGHGQIKAGPAAPQKALHHVGSTEADAELETRHAGLRHHELGRTDLESVADVNAVLHETF